MEFMAKIRFNFSFIHHVLQLFLSKFFVETRAFVLGREWKLGPLGPSIEARCYWSFRAYNFPPGSRVFLASSSKLPC